jgi:hypothetical protein
MSEWISFTQDILPTVAIVGMFFALLGGAFSTLAIARISKRKVDIKRDALAQVDLADKYIRSARTEVEKHSILTAKAAEGKRLSKSEQVEFQRFLTTLDANIKIAKSSIDAAAGYIHVDEAYKSNAVAADQFDKSISKFKKDVKEAINLVTELKASQERRSKARKKVTKKSPRIRKRKDA